MARFSQVTGIGGFKQGTARTSQAGFCEWLEGLGWSEENRDYSLGRLTVPIENFQRKSHGFSSAGGRPTHAGNATSTGPY